jgi:hypothetical protein
MVFYFEGPLPCHISMSVIKHVTCRNQNINVARTMDQGTTNDHFPNHMVSSSSFENNVITNFLKVQRATK